MGTRQAYPSDLSDTEWQQVASFVPAPKPGGRPTKYSRREIMNGIVYVLYTGCAWRSLPSDFPPWRIVFYYFWRWRQSGVWDTIVGQLPTDIRRAAHQLEEPKSPAATNPSVEQAERNERTRNRAVGRNARPKKAKAVA